VRAQGELVSYVLKRKRKRKSTIRSSSSSSYEKEKRYFSTNVFC